MKSKTLVISSICLITLACAPFAMAAGKKAAASPSPAVSSETSATSATKVRPISFHGMVSAVDQTAKTFTIAGKDKSRVFKVSDKTVITKAGKAVTMAEIVENVEVSGSYWKDDAGSLEAKTVKVGPMSEKKTITSHKEKAGPSASPTASPTASPRKP